MKFSTRIDAEMPASRLFDKVNDFNRLEQLLIQRGASVTRIDPADEPGTGMGWNIAFDWRGRERALRLEVVRFDRPEHVTMTGLSEALELTIDSSVVALSQTRSRLVFEADIRPRNMRARLMLQTAKLGKARLDRRFETRIRELVGELGGLG
ncbi:SRPBCC family protein [Paracoccus methylarcula]|uniref:SRPBCC family protein n=1 Tax=Paracoccus methylarcula TaxID=72022 RepID=A0A3R7M7X6_9RHOB|nr:SRPBCC family protein [Paracoccus methylarcula]RNF33496.1 SRPBCC family protein [Paracoccus methylarcula]